MPQIARFHARLVDDQIFADRKTPLCQAGASLADVHSYGLNAVATIDAVAVAIAERPRFCPWRQKLDPA